MDRVGVVFLGGDSPRRNQGASDPNSPRETGRLENHDRCRWQRVLTELERVDEVLPVVGDEEPA